MTNIKMNIFGDSLSADGSSPIYRIPLSYGLDLSALRRNITETEVILDDSLTCHQQSYPKFGTWPLSIITLMVPLKSTLMVPLQTLKNQLKSSIFICAFL